MKRKLLGSALVALPTAAFLWSVWPIPPEFAAAIVAFAVVAAGISSFTLGIRMLTSDGE